MPQDLRSAADRYGIAAVGLATPEGTWQFDQDGVANDADPMPCGEADSPKDIPYLRGLFDGILRCTHGSPHPFTPWGTP